MQAVFQQPELRRMSARARPRVTLRMVLVLFAGLFFCFGSQKFSAPALAKGPARASSYDQLGLPQRRGVHEDSQLCCMMESRLGARSPCYCCLDPIPPLRGGGAKNSSANSTSTMRSATRGLARELTPRSSGCWNTACTHTLSGHVNWRSCSVYLGSNP